MGFGEIIMIAIRKEVTGFRLQVSGYRLQVAGCKLTSQVSPSHL
jgi:hypothetical protein